MEILRGNPLQLPLAQPATALHRQQRLKLFAVRIERHAADDDSVPVGGRRWGRSGTDHLAGRHVCARRLDVRVDGAGDSNRGNEGCRDCRQEFRVS